MGKSIKIQFFQEPGWGFQNGNIFLHKQTQEASICKTGYQETKRLGIFITRNRRFLVVRSAIGWVFDENMKTRGDIDATDGQGGLAPTPHGRSTFSKNVGRKRGRFGT